MLANAHAGTKSRNFRKAAQNFPIGQSFSRVCCLSGCKTMWNMFWVSVSAESAAYLGVTLCGTCSTKNLMQIYGFQLRLPTRWFYHNATVGIYMYILTKNEPTCYELNM